MSYHHGLDFPLDAKGPTLRVHIVPFLVTVLFTFCAPSNAILSQCCYSGVTEVFVCIDSEILHNSR